MCMMPWNSLWIIMCSNSPTHTGSRPPEQPWVHCLHACGTHCFLTHMKKTMHNLRLLASRLGMLHWQRHWHLGLDWYPQMHSCLQSIQSKPTTIPSYLGDIQTCLHSELPRYHSHAEEWNCDLDPLQKEITPLPLSPTCFSSSSWSPKGTNCRQHPTNHTAYK